MKDKTITVENVTFILYVRYGDIRSHVNIAGKVTRTAISGCVSAQRLNIQQGGTDDSVRRFDNLQ